MPLDTSIITQGYNPVVKPVDPQELALRKAQLAGMQQQQQLGAAQLTGANFQNQQNQAAADRAQNVRNTLAANPNADDKTLLASGMDASQLFAYKKSMQDYQKSSVDLKESKNKLQASETATLGSIFGAVKAANYDPKVAASLFSMAAQQHPDYAQHIDQLTSQFGQMQPDQFKSLVDSGAMASMSAKDQASTASAAQTADAKAAQAKTAQDKLTLETPGIQSENAVKANNATGATPLTAKDKAELALRQREVAASELRARTEADKNKQLTQMGEDPTANMSGAQKAYWQNIASGKVPMPTFRGNLEKAQYANSIVMGLNPNYQESLYANRKNFDADMSKDGKRGAVIDRVGTAVEHFDKFFSDSAKSGTMINPYGSANVATKADAQLLTGEVVSAVKSGVATDADAQPIIKQLTSPFQGTREAGAKAYAELLGGKMQQVARDYEVTHPGESFPAAKYFGEKGVAAMRKYKMLGDSGATPAATVGNSHSAPAVGDTFNGGKVLKITKVN